eukprot:631580-Amorphochlora_amoeboformis.AAC.1
MLHTFSKCCTGDPSGHWPLGVVLSDAGLGGGVFARTIDWRGRRATGGGGVAGTSGRGLGSWSDLRRND